MLKCILTCKFTNILLYTQEKYQDVFLKNNHIFYEMYKSYTAIQCKLQLDFSIYKYTLNTVSIILQTSYH